MSGLAKYLFISRVNLRILNFIIHQTWRKPPQSSADRRYLNFLPTGNWLSPQLSQVPLLSFDPREKQSKNRHPMVRRQCQYFSPALAMSLWQICLWDILRFGGPRKRERESATIFWAPRPPCVGCTAAALQASGASRKMCSKPFLTRWRLSLYLKHHRSLQVKCAVKRTENGETWGDDFSNLAGSFSKISPSSLLDSNVSSSNLIVPSFLPSRPTWRGSPSPISSCPLPCCSSVTGRVLRMGGDTREERGTPYYLRQSLAGRSIGGNILSLNGTWVKGGKH